MRRWARPARTAILAAPPLPISIIASVLQVLDELMDELKMHSRLERRQLFLAGLEPLEDSAADRKTPKTRRT